MNSAQPGRATAISPKLSSKAELFTESVIREMTRLAFRHGAVNLSQGYPDFPAPAEIKRAAQEAIAADINQYAITWGAKKFRDAIAENFQRMQGVTVDPEREITVCCGSTEAMISSMMAIINPGDEVVLFEPFYENYGPDAILSGATPRYVKLRPPDWTFDPEELAAAFGPSTKAIILNTPNNPTGKVFERAEFECIRDLCVRWNTFAITDEIYEHMLYDGARHISLASLDGMRDRTITINALSKTYSVTGWRVGWAIASPEVTAAIRKVHDFVTVGAAAPLQEAGAVALQSPSSYYTWTRSMPASIRFKSEVNGTSSSTVSLNWYSASASCGRMISCANLRADSSSSFKSFFVLRLASTAITMESGNCDSRLNTEIACGTPSSKSAKLSLVRVRAGAPSGSL